jgi:Outer membrane protein beta-barrel domain
MLAIVVTLIIAGSRTASAEWFVTPFIGFKFAGDTSFVDLEQGASNTKVTIGASAGWVGPGILGVEADFGYTPRFFERSSGSLVASSQVLTLMGNLVVTAPRALTGYSLRPFVSGGGGLMHVGIDDVAQIIQVDSNVFGIDVGGGAVGDLTHRTSVRFDLRYFKSISQAEEDNVGFGPTRLSFWRAAVGLTIR